MTKVSGLIKRTADSVGRFKGGNRVTACTSKQEVTPLDCTDWLPLQPQVYDVIKSY